MPFLQKSHHQCQSREKEVTKTQSLTSIATPNCYLLSEAAGRVGVSDGASHRDFAGRGVYIKQFRGGATSARDLVYRPVVVVVRTVNVASLLTTFTAVYSRVLNYVHISRFSARSRIRIFRFFSK